jgi:O-methyltransferase domain/Dimerisation domain
METSPPEGGRPPQAQVMQMMTGAWVSQTISAVTALGVPDLVQQHGALTARELAEEHHVAARPEFLERALRACASVGIFTESADGRFGPTALSEVLTSGSPVSVKRFTELIGGRWWKLFSGLSDAIRTGESQVAAQLGPPSVRGGGRRREVFGEAMKSRVESTRGVLAHHDFSTARTVVDVGGGFGHLALALLERYPHLRALVQDLPDVIDIARRRATAEDGSLLARLHWVGGDMFTDVPPGDCYVLKAIIHDWDDAHCLRVLGNCRARLESDGRILCVDNVLPPLGDTGCSSTKFLDMLMMVSLPGKERTESEWRSLYARAGLRVASITLVNPRSGESIIEGVTASG